VSPRLVKKSETAPKQEREPERRPTAEAAVRWVSQARADRESRPSPRAQFRALFREDS
jgi:hypothetical protein